MSISTDISNGKDSVYTKVYFSQIRIHPLQLLIGRGVCVYFLTICILNLCRLLEWNCSWQYSAMFYSLYVLVLRLIQSKCALTNFKIKKHSLGSKSVKVWRTIAVQNRTVKTLYRKFETNIPRNKTALPRSQFLYIHVSVSGLYIPTIGLPILLQENRWTDNHKSDFLCSAAPHTEIPKLST